MRYHPLWPWPLLASALSGCSVFSPLPLWELTKGAGVVVTAAISDGQGTAVNTIYHDHVSVGQVCIEFNPDCQVPDLIPAMQAQLKSLQIESRVYEAQTPVQACGYWVRYSAFTDYGVPLLGGAYMPYVSRISLTLISAQGQVLSSSAYLAERGEFGASKWASLPSKLKPVITALITGQDSAARQVAATKEPIP